MSIYLPDGTLYHDNLVDVGADCDGVFFKSSQFIPDDHVSALRLERDNSLSTPSGDMHRVASVPVEVANKWKREGFDIMREPAAAILARLRQEQLDGFITSNKV